MTRPQLLASDAPRLRGQILRLQAFYIGHPGWYTLGELARAIGAISEAGLSMRLRELTYAPYFWTKEKRIRSGSLREYRLTPPRKPAPQLDLL